MLHNSSVLIVDDEEVMRDVLESLLAREGCRVRLAASGEEAIEAAEAESLDVAIVDVMLPDINGIDVLERLKAIDPELPVVMITAFGTAANTREAFKRGAFDFIEKPFKNDEVLVVLRNAVEQHRLVTENRTLRQSLKLQGHRFSELVGRSSRMQRVFDLVSQAAPTRTTILIQGESGTGKELVARAIHAKSLRSDRPFITVNSGSLPPDLFESNLFGHVKGAFTGAVSPKKGLFELADRGSIFFDEIGIVPLETQAKLLRVIQEREFMRLGGVDTLKVDVRIIAATNIDLKQLVDAGRFREDLYYRLHVITVELPGLRDRPEDIPLLAQHFLTKYGEENHKPGLDLAPEAIRLMEDYHWPGNVRELENAIERAVVFATGTTISADLMPEAVRSSQRLPPPAFEMPPGGLPLRKVMEEMETMLISRSLEAAGGVQKRAAELLQVKPTTLNEMIKRYGIHPRGSRGPAPSTRDDPPERVPARARHGNRAESIAADLLERRLSPRG